MSSTRVAQPCEFIETEGTAFYPATCDLGLQDKHLTHVRDELAT